MIDINTLGVNIYADGANLNAIREAKKIPFVKGFTTNPTLMRQAGVTDYEAFAKEALEVVEGMPLSLEVFSDDLNEMNWQARKIASWGKNVNVKIPVMNTRGESAARLVKELSADGITLNITAMMTLSQVQEIVDALHKDSDAIISVFAGRIADTGRDPMPLMRDAAKICAAKPKSQLLWASPREALNIVQSAEVGCKIITVTPDLIKKINGFNKDLTQFSKETVAMFYNDASASGYSLSKENETKAA